MGVLADSVLHPKSPPSVNLKGTKLLEPDTEARNGLQPSFPKSSLAAEGRAISMKLGDGFLSFGLGVWRSCRA